MTSRDKPTRPGEADVFISYARVDQEFVHTLHSMLEERHRNTWIDWKDIPPTEKWWEEVCRGIEISDTFAFVISKDSVDSRHCMAELAHAVQNNKRLAPIWYREVDDQAIPPDLKTHQWIRWRVSDDPEDAFSKLISALDRDLKWVRAHTRLLMRAKEWESKRRDRSFLLRGTDLKSAEALQAQDANTEKEPRLTPLQKEYIQASRTAAARSRDLVLGTLAFILIVAGLALYAWWQRSEAITRQLAGEALLMSDQGGESLQTSVLLAAEARNNRIGGAASVEADEVIRDGMALLAPPVARLPHGARVNAVDYSPDGKYVATASDDAAARLWDANSGEEVAQLNLAKGLSNVVFSPNGKYVATSSAGGDARVWEVPSGEQVARFPHDAVVPGTAQPRLAFSPDNKLLATTDGVEKTAYVWDIASEKQKKRLELAGPGSLVAFGPGGKRLASASVATESTSNVAQVWDLDSKREISRVEHDDLISGVTFSPDGKRLATASNDRTARVWEVESGEEVSRVEHDESVATLAFSPEGDRLATASSDHTARVWDVESGEEVALFQHDGTVSGLDFSPDGKRLATASSDKTGRVWDIASGHEVARMPHLDTVARVAFSPDGERVTTASFDNTARIWEVESGSMLTVAHEGSVLYGVNFSPDGRYVGTTGFDKTARVWDVESGEELRRVKHDDVVKGVTFSPEGKYLATSSDDNTARVWNIATGEQIARMEHDADLFSVAFSPDGKRLATASYDGIARIWDVDNEEEVARFEHKAEDIYSPVYGVAFGPDGKRLATASSDLTARLWDISTGEEIARVNHDYPVWDVAFSPDGEYLALAGMDGTVRLWEIASKQFKGEPLYHQGPVSSLNFSSDSKYLASASYDHTASIWEVESGEEVARLNHDGILHGVAFSPDGKRLATTSGGIARVQTWQPEGLMEEACDRLTRNLSEEEWQQYVGGAYQKTCPDLPVPGV